MQLTERFLQLVRQQLESLGTAGCRPMSCCTQPRDNTMKPPALVMVDQWPDTAPPLPAAQADPTLRTPCPERRWYPLREGNVLLGALRAERQSEHSWSQDLDQRLQASASATGPVPQP